MNYPADLKYSKNDEWIRVEGKIAAMGITDFAQHQLSDVVFVEVTAAVGDHIEKGAAYASVESVKAAADVYAPASGTLTEINSALANTPELVNTDPYGAAWMIKITLDDAAQLDGLLDAAAYEAYCKEREA